MTVDRKPVIVSLTPLPLSADSRTLKQVTSVARFGFKSIVIEGRPSRFAQKAVPFDVISVGAGRSSQSRTVEAAPAVPPEVISVSAGGNVRSSADEAAQTGTTVEEKLASPNLHTTAAGNVQSLSILRRSPFGQLVVRRIPGSRRVARVFQRCLYQAIASLRGANQSTKQPSAKEIVVALPYALSHLVKEIVALLRAKLLSRIANRRIPTRIFSVIRYARAFALHLAEYLSQYLFQVLLVAPRADIYYLHAFYQFPAVFVLCLWHKAKMIYDAHDFYSQMEDDTNVSFFWKNCVMPFERVVERACVWFADDVVTVNEGIAALMRERFGCEPVILRNVHDLRLDKQPSRTIREVIGLPPDAFLVVSIGNWKIAMAMQEMFDALAGLPKHVHLAFLGAGYPALDEAVASRGIDGRVHVVRPVLPQEVVPFIASADASVVLYFDGSPNYQNALPNRFFQSIAAELPLVYPNLNEIRRLADRFGVGIMANPQDPTEIKSALKVLIEDDERRSAIRKNLRLANLELCWEHEERVLKVLLNRHLGRAGAPVSVVEDKAVG
jgi:glycosyltransferase involved in cell wall biosynthesis